MSVRVIPSLLLCLCMLVLLIASSQVMYDQPYFFSNQSFTFFKDGKTCEIVTILFRVSIFHSFIVELSVQMLPRVLLMRQLLHFLRV